MSSDFVESLSARTGYEDYKYVMQDSGSYAFGGALTYVECMTGEQVPFKFKAIVEHYVLKDDVSPETSLESHLYYMTEDSFAARTYLELKARVRTWMITEGKKGLFGPSKPANRECVLTLKELMRMDVEEKKSRQLKIGELIISKLALMSFSV